MILTVVGFVGSYASLRAAHLGSVELGVALVLAVIGSNADVQNFGPIALPEPVPFLLLVPALAAVAVATACVHDLNLPMRDPLRAKLARAGWVGVCFGVVLVCLVAVLSVTEPPLVAPTARNLLVFSAISIPCSRLAGGQFVWFPALGLSLLTMVFGYSYAHRRYYWWAVSLDEAVTPTQILTALGLGGAALVVYAAVPPAPVLRG